MPLDQSRQPVDVLLQLPRQPGLPHPSLSVQDHELGSTRLLSAVEKVLDQPQVGVPPGEGGFQPVDPLTTADLRDHDPGRPQTYRLRLALQLMLSGVGERDRGTRQRSGRLIDPHPPRLRDGLHPRRGVHRVPGDHALSRRTHTDRHFTGHDPDPHRQARRAHLMTHRRHRSDQLQAGPHRPLGVVLVSDRHPPHRHHRITDELLHHPAVPAHDQPALREVRRQQLTDLLRILALRQRREPHQIPEQHRGHPPLRHRLPGPRRCLPRPNDRDGSPALRAELLAVGPSAAGRAGTSMDRRATLTAELRAGGQHRIANRAVVHPAAPPKDRLHAHPEVPGRRYYHGLRSEGR